MRERMILIAVHRKLTSDVFFPQPTHWIDLPSGYDGSRAAALKLLPCTKMFGPDLYYQPAPEPGKHLRKAITTEQAIGDLPVIDARELLSRGILKRGARRFDTPIKYEGEDRASAYGTTMRNWPGFEGGETIRDHVIRYLPRDYELFSRMSPGDQYPQAVQLAEKMFYEKLDQLPPGSRPLEETRAWTELRKSVVPPYDPGKFPNKWRKMEADKPARTLLAHLGKDGYSHIHYDDNQARTISVREAARLQSFPDGFVFCGTMNPAFRQIGNSVPPLMSKAIADSLLEQLKVALSDGGIRDIAVGE